MENASLFEDQRFPGTKAGERGVTYVGNAHGIRRGIGRFHFDRPAPGRGGFSSSIDRPPPLSLQYLPFVSLHVPGLTNVFNIQPWGIVSRGPHFSDRGMDREPDRILMNRFFQSLGTCPRENDDG